MKNHPVVIVGAGLAGLTAANFLHRHGVPVRVFEASENIAGLARSEFDSEGFTYDCGAHFITNRLAAAVGCSASCKDMKQYGETVRYRKRNYAYPFGLMASPSFAMSAVVSRITGLAQAQAVSVAEHYRQLYGSKLANAIAIPITTAWSGFDGSELAASIGQKFATGILQTMYLTFMKRVTGRTIGIGYSGTFPESTNVWHVYPDGGIGSICEALADDIRSCISTQSPVESILTEDERIIGVQVKGEEVLASAIISTAPAHILPKLVKGTNKLDFLKRFEYRAMVFVNMKLDGISGLPDVVTWTPESQFPFFRLSDIGLGLPFLVPEGKTQVTCDIGCKVGDAAWTATDDELADSCLTGLEDIVPGISKRYLGCRVVRTPLAYPIFKLEYEADRLRFKEGTGIKGLYSVGRNGEFDHILMEDVYWRTRRKALKIIEQRREDRL